MTSLSQKLSKQKGSDLGFWLLFFFFLKQPWNIKKEEKKHGNQKYRQIHFPSLGFSKLCDNWNKDYNTVSKCGSKCT